jgi:hypothetical protein
MNTCPELGEWRAWLDQPDSDLATHLASCSACTSTVADLREGAEVAGSALNVVAPRQLPSHDDVELARARFQWRQRRVAAAVIDLPIQEEQRPVSLWERVSTPWRIAASGLAAALALSVLVTFTPQGQTAAAGFLSQFRSQQLAVVEISPQSQAELQRTLNSLGNLGTVRSPGGTVARGGAVVPRSPEPHAVSLADASREVGFPLLTPDPAALPASVNRTPEVQVIPAMEFRFTFDKAKAASYYRANGNPNISLPDKFDGASLVVSTPAAALLQYSDRDSHQALIVGQAGLLVVNVEGKVSLDEMRDFLLGLPGLPKDTVDQLKRIRNWDQTLPLPVPIDQINWKHETFKGNPGVLLNDNTGAGSAAVWQAGGHLYGVAGTLKANDLKRVAESLR